MAATIAYEEKVIKPAKVYTFQEYLKKEEKSIEKHEFYNGQIIKMSGAKYRHNRVAMNIGSGLVIATKNFTKRFEVSNSDLKIYVESENICVYPDAVVVSEAPVYWNRREDTITNPLLIVEVMSLSTALHDRTTKFLLYKTLPSFKEYVIIDPNKASVETWFKQDEKTWINLSETNLEKEIFLKSMGVAIKLSDIYDRVDFPEKVKR
jgi:Uma2 family endonuclease